MKEELKDKTEDSVESAATSLHNVIGSLRLTRQEHDALKDHIETLRGLSLEFLYCDGDKSCKGLIDSTEDSEENTDDN